MKKSLLLGLIATSLMGLSTQALSENTNTPFAIAIHGGGGEIEKKKIKAGKKER